MKPGHPIYSVTIQTGLTHTVRMRLLTDYKGWYNPLYKITRARDELRTAGLLIREIYERTDCAYPGYQPRSELQPCKKCLQRKRGSDQ
jgi:hypothetical protein